MELPDQIEISPENCNPELTSIVYSTEPIASMATKEYTSLQNVSYDQYGNRAFISSDSNIQVQPQAQVLQNQNQVTNTYIICSGNTENQNDDLRNLLKSWNLEHMTNHLIGNQNCFT